MEHNEPERRRSMDPAIAGLKELLTLRFNGLDQRIEALTFQVRETNGRVRIEEAATVDLRSRVSTMKDDIDALQDTEGDRRGIRVWDVTLVIGTMGATLTLLKVLGKL